MEGNEQELASRSKHVLYEMRMLTGLAKALAFQGRDSLRNGGMPVIENACIESFAIHTRSILDFLYDKRKNEDGMVASDFFDDAMLWKQDRPKKPKLLDDLNARVGTEVAHLTTARLRDDKDWPFLQIAHEVNALFKKFLGLVPQTRLDSSDADAYHSESDSLVHLSGAISQCLPSPVRDTAKTCSEGDTLVVRRF